MLAIPEALLLGISSPYARRGALWEAYRRHYGQDGDPVLVWQADTPSMNPTVDAAAIRTAYDQDEAAAAAEYGAEFRRDIESFIPREAVEACVVPDRRELPPVYGPAYQAFVDPSGGSQDSMTLAIAHYDDGRVVLDLVRERRPPFSPRAWWRTWPRCSARTGSRASPGTATAARGPARASADTRWTTSPRSPTSTASSSRG
jgi:hypothetical protein